MRSVLAKINCAQKIGKPQNMLVPSLSRSPFTDTIKEQLLPELLEMKLHTDETSPRPPAKRQHSVVSKDRYKLFALAALLLLAVWSIFTGTLTLKSSTADPDLSTFSFSNPDDFDVLEVAEREKLVKKLWNVYLHGSGGPVNKIRLPRFWEDAFQAAFERLDSDSPGVRDGALSEIAKMSLSSLDLLPKDAGAGEAGNTSSRKLRR